MILPAARSSSSNARIWLFIICMLGAFISPGCTRHHDHAVVVWAWDIAAAALQKLVPGFERSHPGQHVVVRDLGNSQVYERGMAGCAAGGIGMPDVYMLENSNAEAFWARFPAAFVDLSQYGAQDLVSSFPAFKWTELTAGPKILAIPWDAGPVIVFYRRDLYAQAGIDPAQIQTWDDFLEAGKKMLAATHNRVRMGTIARGVDDEWFRMLASQNGSFYFDPSGQNITINSPGCVQALDTVKKLCDAGILASGGWTEQVQNIKSSTVAGALYGAWFEGSIRNNAPDEAGKWGVYLMPAMRRGGPRAANIGGSALAIPTSSAHKDVAYAFIRYAVAERASQVEMLQDDGLVPAYLPALDDPYVREPVKYWGNQPIWQLILGTLKEIPSTRATEFFAECRPIVATVVGDYLDGRYPSAQACLDEAAQQLSEATGLPSNVHPSPGPPQPPAAPVSPGPLSGDSPPPRRFGP